jgi:type 1 fimbria pilin
MKRVLSIGAKLLSLGLIALAVLKSGPAQAACNLGSNIQNYIIDQVSDVYVDSNLAPGTPLGSQGQYSFPNPWRLNCTGASPVYLATNIAQGSQTSGGVYELTVGGQRSGVGVRVSMSIDGGDFQPMPIERQLTLNTGSPAHSESDTIKVELVRTTSAIVYGTVDQGLGVGASNFYNGTGVVGSPVQYQTMRTGTIKLVRPSCAMDVASLNQTVNLGSYSTRDLQDPSSTTPWVPFKLTMANCGDSKILVDITFGSSQDQDQYNPNLFSLGTGSPAGLGIALSTNDGSDASMQPGVTVTFPGKLTGESYDFRARLERTLAPLTAGQFDRPVTILVTYR